MLASFIRDEDEIPIMLALSLYNDPVQQYGGFVLVANTHRVGCWVKDQVCIVGCRGTSIGGPQFDKDINDDRILAGFSLQDACELSLVQEASKLLKDHNLESMYLIFCGHSLGGRSAMCLANKYPNSKCVMLNAGVPPTNPVDSGPGPSRAIHYHIFGDVISSHMGPNAAYVVRIRKPGKPTWGYAYPHGTERFFAKDGPWVYATVNEEQESWMRSGDQRIPIGKFWARQAVCTQPIPGSTVRCSVLDRLRVFNTTSLDKKPGRVEKKRQHIIRRIKV